MHKKDKEFSLKSKKKIFSHKLKRQIKNFISKKETNERLKNNLAVFELILLITLFTIKILLKQISDNKFKIKYFFKV